MKIVIEIPEDTYSATCNGCMLPPDVENVVNAIKNGTPLPEQLPYVTYAMFSCPYCGYVEIREVEKNDE